VDETPGRGPADASTSSASSATPAPCRTGTWSPPTRSLPRTRRFGRRLEQRLSSARHSLAALLGLSPAEADGVGLRPCRASPAAPQLPVRRALGAGASPTGHPGRRGPVARGQRRDRGGDGRSSILQITLSAGYTASSLNGSGLFDGPGAAWSLVGGVLLASALRRRRPARRSAAPRSPNLSGLGRRLPRNLCCRPSPRWATSYTALDHDTHLLGTQKPCARACHRVPWRLERINYATGASDLLNVLDAQRQFQRASLGYAHSPGRSSTWTRSNSSWRWAAADGPKPRRRRRTAQLQRSAGSRRTARAPEPASNGHGTPREGLTNMNAQQAALAVTFGGGGLLRAAHAQNRRYLKALVGHRVGAARIALSGNRPSERQQRVSRARAPLGNVRFGRRSRT